MKNILPAEICTSSAKLKVDIRYTFFNTFLKQGNIHNICTIFKVKDNHLPIENKENNTIL